MELLQESTSNSFISLLLQNKYFTALLGSIRIIYKMRLFEITHLGISRV